MSTYSNPVADTDWPDPDVVAVDDAFYLVSSSFTRSPGLPLLRSYDLVDWEPAGHAVSAAVPAERYTSPRPGEGVWAPSIRVWGGLVRIYWGDPDTGVWTVTAPHPEGPWGEPTLVLEGPGVIDPCPLVDDDGRVWMVFAWARSRAGIANRLDLVELSADGLSVIGEPRVLIDGDTIDGCVVLEGPKLYRARGRYWVLAPAGGVATGWQYAFRSTSLDGPWESKIVLRQGETAVNGPHQAAWVCDAAGDDWFLHYQDREWAGRVLHLQPIVWSDDDWPIMGESGEPVATHRRPAIKPGSPVIDAGLAAVGPWFWLTTPSPDAPGGHAVSTQASEHADPRALPGVRGRRIHGAGDGISFRLALTGTAPATGGIALLGSTAFGVALSRGDDGTVEAMACAWRDQNHEPEVWDRWPSPSGSIDVAMTIASDGAATIVTGGDKRREFHWSATAGDWVGAIIGIYAAAPPGSQAGLLFAEESG